MAKGSRLAELGVSADHNRGYLLLETPVQFFKEVDGDSIALIVDRGKQPDGEVDSHPAGEGLDGVDLAGGALEGEEAGFDGNQDHISRGEGVEGEQADGWRAVDTGDVVAGAEVVQDGGEALVLVGELGQAASAGFEAGQAHPAGGQVKIAHCPPEEARGIDRAMADGEHGIADVHFDPLLGDAQARGAVRLRVHVHQERGVPLTGECRGKVNGGRGFSTAALLIDDGDGPHGHPRRLGRRDISIKKDTLKPP